MNTIDKARYILNILFLIGAVVTIALYAFGGSNLFLYTGLAAITFKMIEFILRFIL